VIEIGVSMAVSAPVGMMLSSTGTRQVLPDPLGSSGESGCNFACEG
jgi:hypothetical protein